MSTLRLWALLRRRSRRDSRDPASLTSTLAVIAFAATTAVTLVVLGGLLAFIDRIDRGQRRCAGNRQHRKKKGTTHQLDPPAAGFAATPGSGR